MEKFAKLGSTCIIDCSNERLVAMFVSLGKTTVQCLCSQRFKNCIFKYFLCTSEKDG